jgi:hypothetical protein
MLRFKDRAGSLDAFKIKRVKKSDAAEAVMGGLH